VADGFAALESFFDPDLRLPVGDKVYVIPCPTAEDGLKLKARLLTGESMDNAEELKTLKSLCGKELWDRLQHEQSWPKICHIARTGLVHYGYGPEAAELFWERGLDDILGNPVPPPPAKMRIVGALNRMRQKILASPDSTETGIPAEARG
jgi:hypothetical protein